MSDDPPNAETIIATVAAAADSIIAPDHEGRIARIEQVFEKWEPLLLKMADIAEKLA